MSVQTVPLIRVTIFVLFTRTYSIAEVKPWIAYKSDYWPRFVMINVLWLGSENKSHIQSIQVNG